MSNEQTPVDAAPYVLLFQKAHQKIVMLERLEEQLVQLLTRRQELQDELREVQTQINSELEQRLKGSPDAPARVLGAIAGSAGKSNGGGRFAAQTIDPVVAAAE